MPRMIDNSILITKFKPAVRLGKVWNVVSIESLSFTSQSDRNKLGMCNELGNP